MSDGRAARHRCDASQHLFIACEKGKVDAARNAGQRRGGRRKRGRMLLEVFDKEHVGNDKFMGHAPNESDASTGSPAGTATGDARLLLDMSPRSTRRRSSTLRGRRSSDRAPGGGGAGVRIWRAVRHPTHRLPGGPRSERARLLLEKGAR